MITSCVMLLAILQAGYLVVDAKRDKRNKGVEAHEVALEVHEASTTNHNQVYGQSLPHSTRREDAAHDVTSGKSATAAKKGARSHHHHHHKKGHHDNRPPQPANHRADVVVEKSQKPVVNLLTKSSHAAETTSVVPAQDGEPLQVHISVERVTHRAETQSPAQKVTSDPDEHVVNDVPAPTAGRVAAASERSGERKHGHKHLLSTHACDDHSDCSLGECCVETHRGHMMCRKGGYKSSGRHCYSSCVCKQGLECVFKESKKASKQGNRAFGRCKAPTL